MNYPDACSASRALYARAKKVMPGGNTRTTVYIDPFPIYAVRGAGARCWDADGNEYIDCINNFTSMIHGYLHPGVNEAVTEQLRSGTCFGMPTLSEIELAELLSERLPAVEQLRFTNSGTEAVMMAIKAARAFTSKPKIAKIEGAYHGSYDYAEISLDSTPSSWGENQPKSIPYAKGTPAGVIDDVVVLPLNDVSAARQAFEEHGSQLAAVLIDPLPNRAGLIPARKEYLEALAALARSAGALLIFDEVISFRLGHSGAQGLWGIAPDLTVLGKIIGGGFPIGAVGGRADVMAVFDPSRGKPALPHGGTFSANPVTMTAGLACMKALNPAAFDRLNVMGDRIRKSVNDTFQDLGIPGVCVGLGSLFKIHFASGPISDYRSVYPDSAAKKKLAHLHIRLLSRGVLAASYGLFALSTPMTDDDVTLVSTKISDTLKEIASVN